MKFLDEVKIFVKSGDGGSGCASFRREKFIEFGGPNGVQVALVCQFRGPSGVQVALGARQVSAQEKV